MASIEVELHVRSLDVAEDFYGRLGFMTAWRHPGPGTDAYLVMRRDDAVIRFWPGPPHITTPVPSDDASTQLGVGVEIIVSVEDLDIAYAAARRLGAVADEMRERPWGLRDFRVTDPFGYYLRFTEPHDVLDESYGGRP